MEKPKTHIEVKVSVESIRDSLRKKIVSEHSALIANVIIGNLASTEVGLEHLYKAMSGIQDKFKYKVGDLVRVEMDHLYSWQFDKDKTEQQCDVVQKKLLCQVRSINPAKKQAYELAYTAISGASAPKEMTSMVAEEKMHLDDEWPEDLGEEEDLPF
jgi:hypothetical protein